MTKERKNKGRTPSATLPPSQDADSSDDENIIGEVLENIIDEIIGGSGSSKLDPGKKTDVIEVLNTSLHVKKNSAQHTTSKYDNKDPKRLVVRRGKPFIVTLTLSRPYDKHKDHLNIVFKTGNNPKPGQGTYVSLKLKEDVKMDGWEAKLVKKDKLEIDIQIQTPPKCAVSRWQMIPVTSTRGPVPSNIYNLDTFAVIDVLFNPWNKADQVYLEEDDRRAEYVLNDTGCIYKGTMNNIIARPWVFGQFEDKVLDCVFHLLDKSSLSWNDRRDPVMVCRKLSAMGNSKDDEGVLEANWSNDGKDGKKPLSWTGSAKILRKYYKTMKTVKYGECWVFSGVFTTLCRALGIPARSVTIYEAAHDTDFSITIDKYVNEDGKVLEDRERDSIWNFHAWNEVWMQRPDLPEGFGGWQVIDPTPHGKSDGEFQCGPMSVEAIRNGDVYMPYDGSFIFGSVNADVVTWLLDSKSGTTSVAGISSSTVGHSVSTKAVGDRGDLTFEEFREDITDNYKFPEDSAEERAVVIKASKYSSKPPIYYSSAKDDISFDLVQGQTSLIGMPFCVTLSVINNAKQARTIGGRIEFRSVYYTGVPYKKIYTSTFADELIETGGAPNFPFYTIEVPFEKYDGRLAEHGIIQVSCVMRVKETNQIFSDDYSFSIVKPNLIVQVKPKEVRVDEPFTVDISFDNPLPITLTKCDLAIEGPGLHNTLRLRQGNVDAKKRFHTSLGISAARAGEREIVATFNASELSDITGYCKLIVTEEFKDVPV